MHIIDLYHIPGNAHDKIIIEKIKNNIIEKRGPISNDLDLHIRYDPE